MKTSRTFVDAADVYGASVLSKMLMFRDTYLLNSLVRITELYLCNPGVDLKIDDTLLFQLLIKRDSLVK